jgi:hypothetical protein
MILYNNLAKPLCTVCAFLYSSKISRRVLDPQNVCRWTLFYMRKSLGIFIFLEFLLEFF